MTSIKKENKPIVIKQGEIGWCNISLTNPNGEPDVATFEIDLSTKIGKRYVDDLEALEECRLKNPNSKYTVGFAKYSNGLPVIEAFDLTGYKIDIR